MQWSTLIQLISMGFVCFFHCLNVFANRTGLKKTFNSIFKLFFLSTLMIYYVHFRWCTHEFSSEFMLVNIFHPQHCAQSQCIFIITYEKFGSSWVKFVSFSQGNFVFNSNRFLDRSLPFLLCRIQQLHSHILTKANMMFTRVVAEREKARNHRMREKGRGGWGMRKNSHIHFLWCKKLNKERKWENTLKADYYFWRDSYMIKGLKGAIWKKQGCCYRIFNNKYTY